MNFNTTCLKCNTVFGFFCNLKKGIVETYEGPASTYTHTRNLKMILHNKKASLFCIKCNSYVGFKNQDNYILLHKACRTPI